MTKWIRLTAVLLLVGCAAQQAGPSWQKAGASSADATAALNACTHAATQALPVDMEQIQIAAGYNTAAGTGCGFTPSSATQSCASSGTYVQPQTRLDDKNQPLRNKAITACMVQRPAGPRAEAKPCRLRTAYPWPPTQCPPRSPA